MIILTSYPPQMAVAFTPEQMSRLDRRFQQLSSLPGDPQPLVRDSATLLNSALTLTVAGRTCSAEPDQALPGARLTEAQWAQELSLTTAPQEVSWTAFEAVCTWPRGAAYLFDGHLQRGYNLNDEMDRLELEFLLGAPPQAGRVLRAHRLRPDGALEQWRTSVPVSSEAKVEHAK